MKTLHCAHLGFDCSQVITAETEEEILQQAAEHARAVHNLEVTPEIAEQARQLIQEEGQGSEDDTV